MGHDDSMLAFTLLKQRTRPRLKRHASKTRTKQSNAMLPQTQTPKHHLTGAGPGAREGQPGMGKTILIYIHVHEERNPKEG